MIYEMRAYSELKQFNEDAVRRYNEAWNEAGPIGYACWWTAEQVIHVSESAFVVLWARVIPTKKRHTI